MRYVVKMENGRGLVEWYRNHIDRRQSARAQDALKFDSLAEAERVADVIRRGPDWFSGAYWHADRGVWTLTATVEPYVEAPPVS